MASFWSAAVQIGSAVGKTAAEGLVTSAQAAARLAAENVPRGARHVSETWSLKDTINREVQPKTLIGVYISWRDKFR